MNPLTKIKNRSLDNLKKVDFRSKIKSLVNLSSAAFARGFAKARTVFVPLAKAAQADTIY